MYRMLIAPTVYNNSIYDNIVYKMNNSTDTTTYVLFNNYISKELNVNCHYHIYILVEKYFYIFILLSQSF